jgi:hypothetical protein
LDREEAMTEYRQLDVGDRLPLDNDPFDGMELGCVCDGDYPPHPCQTIFEWLPEEIAIGPYTDIRETHHNGEMLWLDPDHEKEIVAAFEAAGYRCTKDEELVAKAFGYFDGH